jgi:WhiB family transcriptional regulator, redox-sensing transcriptional regulator
VKSFEQHDRHEDWRAYAACKSEDPELFFPVGQKDAQIEAAKLICRRCIVIDDCLTFGISSGSDFGIWGGMTEEERRELKRRTNQRAV